MRPERPTPHPDGYSTDAGAGGGRKAQEAAEEAAMMQQAGVGAQRQCKTDLDKLRAQLQAP